MESLLNQETLASEDLEVIGRSVARDAGGWTEIPPGVGLAAAATAVRLDEEQSAQDDLEPKPAETGRSFAWSMKGRSTTSETRPKRPDGTQRRLDKTFRCKETSASASFKRTTSAHDGMYVGRPDLAGVDAPGQHSSLPFPLGSAGLAFCR